MRRVWPAITVAALIALTTVGCTNASDNPNTYPTDTFSPSATPSMPNPSGLPTVPPGYIDEDTGQTIAPVPVATWSDAERAAVIEAADAAMTAFARPGLDQDTWWSELSPRLTPQARTDYAYVQASAVPATRVTGSGTITDDTSAMVAHVAVPTDVGSYTLILTRLDGASPWLVARFTPPEGVR